MHTDSHEISHSLVPWSNGDQGVLELLTVLVHSEVHRAAKRRELRLAEAWLHHALSGGRQE